MRHFLINKRRLAAKIFFRWSWRDWSNRKISDSFFHELNLGLFLGDLDFDWKSEGWIFFEKGWGFNQVDTLLQFFLSLPEFLGFLPLHPAKVFPFTFQMIYSRPLLCFSTTNEKLKQKWYLRSMCLASLMVLTLSIFLMAFSVFSARVLSYLSGLLRFLSNSKVVSWKQNREWEDWKNTQIFFCHNYWIYPSNNITK